jgi:hypothetical protein
MLAEDDPDIRAKVSPLLELEASRSGPARTAGRRSTVRRGERPFSSCST